MRLDVAQREDPKACVENISYDVTDCRFCRIASASPGDDGERAYEIESGVMAFASKGALVSGWTLIVPKDHASSMAKMPVRVRENIWRSAELTRIKVSEYFGSPAVLFEHGALNEDSPVSCTTSHTHIHVVPISASVLKHAKEMFPLSGKWKSLSSREEIAKFKNSDYLMISEESGCLDVIELDSPISQYFRRVIASMIGFPDHWNWRENSESKFYEETEQFLAETFSHAGLVINSKA